MTKNSDKFQVRNGNIGQIKEINLRAKTIRAELDSGKTVKIDLKTYDNISLGYAVTAHKSQGATYESAHLFISNQDQKEIAYVKASRVKGNSYFYMDKDTAGESLRSVSKQMTKTQAKELAVTFQKSLGRQIEHSR